MIRKYKYLGLLLLIPMMQLRGQGNTSRQEGFVSYKSSRNVYIKMPSTELVEIGDTLDLQKDGQFLPALIVESKSAISLVCRRIEGFDPEIGDYVSMIQRKSINMEEQKSGESIAEAKEENTDRTKEDEEADSNVKATKNQSMQISGRIGVRSYAGISSQEGSDYLRMRYIFSIKGVSSNEGGPAFESYMAFNHKNGEWNEIRDNIYEGLKVYNANFSYGFKSKTKITLGRKINGDISNVGAIDGLQVEQGIGSFNLGAFGGFRPNYTDYGFSASLPQFGTYLSHRLQGKNGVMRNTISLVEQRNGSYTDRRFLYFQHSNNLAKDLYLFTSVEMNLYDMIDSTLGSAFNLSSFYFLARYRLNDRISLSASYDVRNNLIYFETYKNYLDQLIDDQTRQGLNLSGNYRIKKHLSLNLRASYRYREGDKQAGTNLSGSIYFSKLPLSGMTTHMSTNYLNTQYLKGTYYGLRLNQSMYMGKLGLELYYRYFNGTYVLSDLKSVQHIGQVSFNWRIYKKYRCNLSYEAILENSVLNSRIYGQISKRF